MNLVFLKINKFFNNLIKEWKNEKERRKYKKDIFSRRSY